MLLLLVAVVVGVLVGRAQAPLGAHGYRPGFHRIPLLGVGAMGNLLAYFLDGGVATVMLALSLAVLLAFVGANTHVTGVAVIGCGLLLNLIAVVVNNGMPVRGSALVAADVVKEADLAGTSFAGPRHLESGTDRAAVLGDVLPLPIAREVMSFGDLIIVFGAADAVRELARRRRRAWTDEQRAAFAVTQERLLAIEGLDAAPPVEAAPPAPEERVDLTGPLLPRRSSRLVTASRS
ncbi:MAG: DUF5317 family protein [Acidimicrobiales bacterium]